MSLRHNDQQLHFATDSIMPNTSTLATKPTPTLLEQLIPIAQTLPQAAADAEASRTFLQLCLQQAKQPIVTTSFGPQSGVLLHMVTQVIPDIPVIWVDSGYNLPATYRHAETLTKALDLNLQTYTPKTSAAFWDATQGGIPTIEDERHGEFSKNFKITPFKQALAELQPDMWVSSIRQQQSDHRAGLPPVHEGANGVIKLAPFIYWQEEDLQAYLQHHKIADEQRYFDPVKAQYGRECGLHKL